MKQVGSEKEDHLKRIQEEIDEVAQRERELRNQLMKRSSLKDNLNDDAMSTTHSDDSGFSTSPSPVNGQSSDETKEKPLDFTKNTIDYDNIELGHQKTQILFRTMSTPQIYTPSVRRFNGPSVQKGIMAKFIASRGKIAANKTAGSVNQTVNTNPIEFKQPLFILPTTVATTNIERDADGKPIRRGYVPVEEKIQKELREMRNREVELKRLRKQVNLQRHPNSDICSNDNNDEDYESETDDFNYDYPPPGKLRATKSIGELCDAITNSSLSPRNSPSPNYHHQSSRDGIRPALSLAQLCDLEPEDAPSSHRLIAQWENIIQKRKEVA